MMAIQGTSPESLRSVMAKMCNSSAEIRRVAESFLLVPSSIPQAESKKRKVDEMSSEILVPKYDTCEHCEEEFEVALNEGELCSWHTGESQTRSSFVSSVYIKQGRRRLSMTRMMMLLGVIMRIGGKANRDTTRLIYLLTRSGWRWTCCRKLGDGEGCVQGPHAGTQYLGVTFATRDPGADEGLPDAKHQKLNMTERKLGDSFTVDQDGFTQPRKVVRTQAPEIITVLDSSDEVGRDSGDEDDEEEEEANEGENMQTCINCYEEYDANIEPDEDEVACRYHSGIILFTFNFYQ